MPTNTHAKINQLTETGTFDPKNAIDNSPFYLEDINYILNQGAGCIGTKLKGYNIRKFNTNSPKGEMDFRPLGKHRYCLIGFSAFLDNGNIIYQDMDTDPNHRIVAPCPDICSGGVDENLTNKVSLTFNIVNNFK